MKRPRNPRPVVITERTDPGHHRLNVSSGYIVITKDDLATDKPCLRQPTEVQDHLKEIAYLRILQKAFADPVWQQIQQSAQVVGDDRPWRQRNRPIGNRPGLFGYVG